MTELDGIDIKVGLKSTIVADTSQIGTQLKNVEKQFQTAADNATKAYGIKLKTGMNTAVTQATSGIKGNSSGFNGLKNTFDKAATDSTKSFGTKLKTGMNTAVTQATSGIKGNSAGFC